VVENTTTCMESETGKRAHSMEGVMWELSRLCYICDGDVQDCEETEKVWIETGLLWTQMTRSHLSTFI